MPNPVFPENDKGEMLFNCDSCAVLVSQEQGYGDLVCLLCSDCHQKSEQEKSLLHTNVKTVPPSIFFLVAEICMGDAILRYDAQENTICVLRSFLELDYIHTQLQDLFHMEQQQIENPLFDDACVRIYREKDGDTLVKVEHNLLLKLQIQWSLDP